MALASQGVFELGTQEAIRVNPRVVAKILLQEYNL